MSNKKRKCKHCKAFKPALNGLQTPVGYFCCYEHAQAWSLKNGAQKRAKIAREEVKQKAQERRERKEKLRDRRWYEKKAQQVFNKWIRERDKDNPCISCQTVMTKKINAGHYRSVGSSPQLRFNPKNCHAQCEKCNSYLSGNIADYRKNLTSKIGLENVEALENNNELKKWSIEELKSIIQKYKL